MAPTRKTKDGHEPSGGRKTKIKKVKNDDKEPELEFDDMGRPIDQTKIAVKPDDQLVLTDAELNVEYTRILTAKNPHAPDNIINFDFKTMQFTEQQTVNQLEINYKQMGSLIHEDSEEAVEQNQGLNAMESVQSENSENLSDARRSTIRESTRQSILDVEARRISRQHSLACGTLKKPKLIRNQFNYGDRGAQTSIQPYREKMIQTQPPPQENVKVSISQWEIYDYYQDYLKQQAAAKEKVVNKSTANKSRNRKSKKLVTIDEKSEMPISAARIVERMCNQNTYESLADDFKYFDDPSDTADSQTGTLLPLWKFEYEKTLRQAVTNMAWCTNCHNQDLMVVSYGSFDFEKQPRRGYLIYYSLKNPSYPEFIFSAPFGIMSLDVHPSHGYITACGLYNGSVAIFNVKESKSGPLFMSNRDDKHSHPVWSIKWLPDDMEGRLNFCSISTDGCVCQWTLVKNDLIKNCVACLVDSSMKQTENFEDTWSGRSLASGLCIDFHPNNPNIFLCGTEEGKVFKCSMTYSSKFLSEFKAHDGAINSIKWNIFHDDIYATCGSDWSLKIWYAKDEVMPLFNFDLGSSVNDLAWAPYSSTVIAAVTEGDNSKAVIYDLNIDKYTPLCDQAVSQKKKTRLTQVQFNSKHHILVIGDDRGCVNTFKLSPNLRKVGVKSKKDPSPLPLDMAKESAKLDKVINVMMDDTEF